jgi:hypothetical protein
MLLGGLRLERNRLLSALPRMIVRCENGAIVELRLNDLGDVAKLRLKDSFDLCFLYVNSFETTPLAWETVFSVLLILPGQGITSNKRFLHRRWFGVPENRAVNGQRSEFFETSILLIRPFAW